MIPLNTVCFGVQESGEGIREWRSAKAAASPSTQASGQTVRASATRQSARACRFFRQLLMLFIPPQSLMSRTHSRTWTVCWCALRQSTEDYSEVVPQLAWLVLLANLSVLSMCFVSWVAFAWSVEAFTLAQRTPAFSTCHRHTNAPALGQDVPQNRLPFDTVAERRQALSRVEPAEGSQDSEAAATTSATAREQAWSPQQTWSMLSNSRDKKWQM